MAWFGQPNAIEKDAVIRAVSRGHFYHMSYSCVS